jgi:hypothetical protein
MRKEALKRKLHTKFPLNYRKVVTQTEVVCLSTISLFFYWSYTSTYYAL